MAILALDIATHMGWAILDERSPDLPFLGSVRFPSDKDEIGRSANALWRFLEERHAMHGGLKHIIFEAQHAAAKMDMHVLKRLVGLAAVTEMFADRHGAICYEVSIGTWRKHAFGTGNMKREIAKQRAMEGCRALGFDPANDNEAEAFFILDYFVALRNRHGARIPVPWRDRNFFSREAARR